MKVRITLYVAFLSFFFSQSAFSQCFQIESILVNACNAMEGNNEMVRFKTGATPLNVNTLVVNWPNHDWEGLIQNSSTAAVVANLNGDILDDGGCGQLLEPPVTKIIPANSTVILVTSYLFDPNSNPFGPISDTVYIIFQNANVGAAGHFSNTATTLRTLSMTAGSCSDTVSYLPSNFSNLDGDTVTFTPSGTASYVNYGCSAPVPPFTVDAGTANLSGCAGTVLSLSGTAQGHQGVQWSAPQGTFSNATNLSTSYTIPAVPNGTVITLTLTVTNGCNTPISDTVNVTVTGTTMPTFNPVAGICAGGTLSPLATTSLNGITGSWSPALNNTATTTYTFTPNAGQCASQTTLAIAVNTSVVPTFNPVAGICAGGTLSPLPTTSLNGITGSWSPALNNTATTTYTFTPNAGQCASQTTLAIAVNTAVTPTFNPVAGICTGGTLLPLPTTSLNGITGSWSPALNNTATTTYTFTPNAGQCASQATLAIAVNTAVTPTFNPVAGICTGGTLSPLPTTSLNGITGSWSPALNNTATTTYTFTPNAGQCAAQTTLAIAVNTSVVPTFNPIAGICTGGTLSPLPTTSLNGIIGSWSPALNNTATTTYTFTPNAGQCASQTTLAIAVNTAVVPTFNPVAGICTGGTLSPLPTTSLNGITGSWSPALNNTATTTYTFTPNAGQCASQTTLAITVNTAVVPTFNPVAGICTGGTLLPLPATSLNGITGSWSPALNNTATTTYTFTPNAGQCASQTTLAIAVNTAVLPTFNPVAGICTGGTLLPLPATSLNGITGSWSPALNNTATTTYTFTPNAGQCASQTTLAIAVNTAVIPTFNPVAGICTGGTLSPLPTTSLNGITGSWSPALNNTATTTYTFTPNAGQCASQTTLAIAVNTSVVPTFNPVAGICMGGTLSPLPTTSLNGIVGSWSPALNNTATTTYTFTPNAGQCAAVASMEIKVSSLDFIINDQCRDGKYVLYFEDMIGSNPLEYAWTDQNGANVGNDAFFDVSDWLQSSSKPFPLTFYLKVKSGSGCEMTREKTIYGAFCKIPKGISPNNDGDNDSFDLTGLGVKNITIVNRYGTEVFRFQNYTNQWHGQTSGGKELPDATYFYVIEKANGESMSGWVYVNR